ncbi:hypothetical protein SAMN04487968_112117 [Nocardioides terrae]|uniref:Uncharacterized protein n=1 Tax=Nocardioides terrae TaxID=574651 RepID=A0A1I1MI91_9ACTN|nr:hypothetical protein [Nocardioides terrae]SFC85139.1 hypothetical protein SAMN04487968_112117 [Nocardioides terrae]
MTLQIAIGNPLDKSSDRMVADLSVQRHLTVLGRPDDVRDGLLQAIVFQFLMADGAAWTVAPKNGSDMSLVARHFQRAARGAHASERAIEKLHGVVGKREKAASGGGWWKRLSGEAKPLAVIVHDEGWEDDELSESRALLAEVVARGPQVGVHLVVDAAEPSLLTDSIGGGAGSIVLRGKFQQPREWHPLGGAMAEFEFSGYEVAELSEVLRKRFPDESHLGN